MAEKKKTNTKVVKKETIKRATIKDMKALGIHKKEYNRLIDIYAETIHQYLRAVADFEASGYQYESKTAEGNPKKSAIVTAMDTLRKDILQYSDRLCLNPKSIESVTKNEGKESKLASVLSKLEK